MQHTIFIIGLNNLKGTVLDSVANALSWNLGTLQAVDQWSQGSLISHLSKQAKKINKNKKRKQNKALNPKRLLEM